MSDLPQLKIKLTELSNEDLFRMVNEDIVDFGKEEISLAYEELERRGLVSPTIEKPPLMSPVGCLLGVIVLVLELSLIHQDLFVDKELLPFPRAVALAMLVAWVSSYWHGTKFHRKFWKHFLWSAGLVLLGSLALWDLPNLLSQRIPVILAFGIPVALFAALLFWLYEFYFPRARQNADREKG